MAYLCWEADKPRPQSPDYFSACDHGHAAELYVEMMREMYTPRASYHVAVDDENGEPPQVFTVKVATRVEAVREK